MLDLTQENEILLYHGSFVPIPIMDLNKCRDGKDFGKGFSYGKCAKMSAIHRK
jgi:hypothetical protein